MSFSTLIRKIAYTMLGVIMAGVFAGCGGKQSNVAEATALIQSLDYRGALEALDTAEENEENLRLIYRARGIAYMGLVDYGNAIACFEEAIALSNGLIEEIDFDLNYYLAAAYTKNGQYAEAERIYGAILNLCSAEEDAYFLRGNVRMVLGNVSGAEADFDKVVELAPENYDRLVEIYEVLAYFGYDETGKDYLRVALDTSGAKQDKYVTGLIYYYLGEYQNAYVALEEVKEDGSLKSYLYLGKAYEATGDYNYAANVYNSYLNKYEGDAEMYNQLGLCEMTRKEYQKALDAFQAGIALGNGTLLQTLSFNQIVAYEYLGDYEQACLLMESYLQNYPDDEAAIREYHFLSTR